MSFISKMLTILLALTLAACGGGGGGSKGGSSAPDDELETGTPAATTSVERVSLTGLAIKGLAVGARVELFPLVEGVFADTASVTGSTDATGRYKFSFAADQIPAGVVKVRLSYQAGAQLQCDNINSGDDANACGSGNAVGELYDMPEDFELVTIANFDSTQISDDGARIINLSALTTLASILTEDDETDDTNVDKVLKAQAQIRALFELPAGTDLVTSDPDNLTDAADSGDDVYGTINAAFQRIADDEGMSIDSVIAEYVQMLQNNNGQIVIKSADAEIATLQKLINAALALDNLDTELDAVQQTITDAVNDEVTDYAPPVVNLGNNQSVTPGATVNLSAATVQGTPATYSWSTSAPGINFSAAASQSFNAPVTEGNYTVSVVVADADGFTSQTSITLQVKAATVVANSLDGDYYLAMSSTRIEENKTDGTSRWITEKEDGSFFRISTGSNGSFLMAPSTYSATNRKFELTLVNNWNVFSEIETLTSDSSKFPFAVQANGIATATIAEDSAVELDDGSAYADEAFDVRFMPVGNGLMVGFGMADSREYGLTGSNTADSTNILFDSREAISVLLGKKSNLNSITNTDFVGFELGHNVGPYTELANLEANIFDRKYSFDAGGEITVTQYDGIDMGSSPTSINQVIDADSIVPDANPIYTLANGRMVREVYNAATAAIQYHIHDEMFVAADKSAMIYSREMWKNTTAATAFDDVSPLRRGALIGILIRSPGASVNLANKSFSVAAQGYIGNEDIWGMGTRIEFGTVTFGTDTMTLTLSGKVAAYVPENSGSTSRIVKPAASRSRTLVFSGISSLQTAADGCLDILNDDPSVEGVRVCTDGTTLLMRTHGMNENIKSVDLFVGTSITP